MQLVIKILVEIFLFIALLLCWGDAYKSCKSIERDTALKVISALSAIYSIIIMAVSVILFKEYII